MAACSCMLCKANMLEAPTPGPPCWWGDLALVTWLWASHQPAAWMHVHITAPRSHTYRGKAAKHLCSPGRVPSGAEALVNLNEGHRGGDHSHGCVGLHLFGSLSLSCIRESQHV